MANQHIVSIGHAYVRYVSALDWLHSNKFNPSGWYIFYSLHYHDSSSGDWRRTDGGMYILLEIDKK